MNDQARKFRLQELEAERQFLVTQIEDAKKECQDRAIIAEKMLKYTDLEARIDEINLWTVADEKSARYGTQIRVNGMWQPKLPVYGSVEEALEAMNSPDGGFGHSAGAVRAAREMRAKEDYQGCVWSLDGRSPLIPEDERKPFNITL